MTYHDLQAALALAILLAPCVAFIAWRRSNTH